MGASLVMVFSWGSWTEEGGSQSKPSKAASASAPRPPPSRSLRKCLLSAMPRGSKGGRSWAPSLLTLTLTLTASAHPSDSTGDLTGTFRLACWQSGGAPICGSLV